MRLRITAAPLAALLLAAPSLALAAHAQQRPLTNPMVASTVIVHGDYAVASDTSDNGLRNQDYCSGVVVGRRGAQEIVVTARHCTTYAGNSILLHGRTTVDAKPSYVKFHDGDRAKVVRVVDSSTDDLALLYVAPHHAHPVARRDSAVGLGEQIYVLGQPYGFPWTISKGYAAQGDSETARTLIPQSAPDGAKAIDAHYDNALMIVCTGCGPGDSGAGVWNGQGHLVGVEVAANGNYSLMLPVRRVYALLAGLEPPEKPHNAMIDTPGAVDWIHTSKP